MAQKVVLKGKAIPRFKSYEEEANFWDTHSPLDYGTWKEVKLEFAKPLVHILGIRLDAHTLTELSQLAHAMGVGPSTLVRMWTLEKLNALSNPPKAIRTHHQRPIASPLHKIAPKRK